MEWINRGGVLIRRINSERIAEDPHIKYYLHAEEQEKQVWQSFTWTPQPIGSPDEEMKVHWTEKVVQHLHHATYQLKQEDVLMQISPRYVYSKQFCVNSLEIRQNCSSFHSLFGFIRSKIKLWRFYLLERRRESCRVVKY